jgi:DNA mismatch repair endonuclease MutH
MRVWLAIEEAMRLYSRMERSIGNFKFEDQDFESILAHAKRLEGRTLEEVANLQGTPQLLQELSGKGAAGQLLQVWFGLPVRDNRPQPDLVNVRMRDGNVVDVEIKVVPVEKRGGSSIVKQRCKVTNINYRGLLNEEWLSSRARHKLSTVLFIYYRYTDINSWQESTVDKVITWRLDESAEQEIIYSDWKRTWGFVNDGLAHKISEGHNSILGASTAGDSRRVAQPHNAEISAPRRAFSLKTDFLRTRYEMARKPSRYIPLKTLTGREIRADLHSDVLERLYPYIGRTLDEVRTELGMRPSNAKNFAALVIKRILRVSVGNTRALELELAGVKPKTTPVPRNGFYPFEAMSFPQMDLSEFAEETWEESGFRADLDCLLIVPIVGIKKTQKYPERIIGRPFFWVPTIEEQEGIAAEWRHFQQQVTAGLAAYRRTARGRESGLTHASQTNYIHIRPKGRDGGDDGADSSGRPTQRVCFWLNQSFMETLLKRTFIDPKGFLEAPATPR